MKYQQVLAKRKCCKGHEGAEDGIGCTLKHEEILAEIMVILSPVVVRVLPSTFPEDNEETGESTPSWMVIRTEDE